MRKNHQKPSAQERLTQGYLLLLLTAFVLYPGLHGYEAMGEAKKQMVLWLTGGSVSVAVLLENREPENPEESNKLCGVSRDISSNFMISLHNSSHNS